jgi:hypothetical protein
MAKVRIVEVLFVTTVRIQNTKLQRPHIEVVHIQARITLFVSEIYRVMDRRTLYFIWTSASYLGSLGFT